MRRGLFLENAFALVKEELCRGLNAVKDDLHEEAQPVAEQPRTITCRMDFIKQLAHGPSRFDPARNKDVLTDAEWRNKVSVLDVVDALKQTHNEVGRTFRHGPHAGQAVEHLVENLKQGSNPFDDDWVVCGNRRLKALKEYVVASGSLHRARG